MLGWGHNTHLYGGLGVACANLCKALSKKATITLFIPQAENSIPDDNIDLISVMASDDEVSGGKQWSEHELEEREEVEAVEHTIEIPVELQPYLVPSTEKELVQELRRVRKSRQKSTGPGDEGDELQEAEPGEDNILDRVMEYARLVAERSKHIDFDIIHAHDWMTFLAGIYVKNGSGKPLVLHIHSLDYDRVGGKDRTWVFNIERYAMSRADHVIAVSAYTAGIIVSRYGLSSNRVRVIHNGIDPMDTFRLPPETSEKTVLFVGRITGMKGPKYFLEIADHVYRKYKNVRFVMVGAGDELTEIKDSNIYRKLGDRIDLRGYIEPEELRLIYATADVYCLPSVSEPFGLTALEAAQFGIPIVLSSRSGVSEILKSALRADYWDIETMANHIVSLLRDDKLRAKQIEAGYREIKNITWEETARSILGIYKNLLG